MEERYHVNIGSVLSLERINENGEREILLQLRQNTGYMDDHWEFAAGGHLEKGETFDEAMVREAKEELGIDASPDQLSFAGTFRIRYEKEFHGRIFRDNEFTTVFVYHGALGSLTLQESEVSEVRWFSLNAVWEEIHRSRARFCVPEAGLRILRTYLGLD